MQSVLSQDYTDIELLIVDDGSTDNTAEVVASFADPRVRYLYQENSGACRARNYGVEEAKGEYIAFQDSDDEWVQGKLSSQIKFIREQGVDMVYGVIESFNEDGSKEGTFPCEFPPVRESREALVRRMLYSGTVCTQTVLVKADAMKACHFDESMPRLQEWEWSVRFARTHDVAFQSEVCAIRYMQTDSLSRMRKTFPLALSKIFYKNIDFIQNDKALWKKWIVDVANFRFMYGYPAGKECWKAFLTTGNPKFFVKSILCLFKLEKKVGKYAN